ncbi:MAG: energy transducer TonB [Prevotella sp.]|nr:energy transducer TonB [Prevotella sp.]
MEKGKRTCNVLKAVRLQIAKANEIKYEPHECHHEGPCAGTCPACEAEVKYLEQQLVMRRMLGKAVVLTGIAASMTSLTACGQNKLPNGCENDTTITELAGDVADVDGLMEMPEPEVEEVVMGKMPAPVDTIRPINNDEKVLTGVVEYQPQFPGGIKACEQFIKENLRYPDTESDVQGRVIVSFMVERDGSLSDIKVVRGLDPAFDEEALRVVKMMPKWSPGATDGKISVMRYTIPIIFKKE